MKAITEKDNEEFAWYNEASEQTLETLPNFIKHLTEDYRHDYGTICKAISAAMIGTAWAINKTDQGCITGFQAGAIMWEFILHWNRSNNKCGLELVDYDKMLFPQYECQFEKTISSNTFRKLQENAIKNLKMDTKLCSEEVVEHWRSIADGKIPFGYTIKD